MVVGLAIVQTEKGPLVYPALTVHFLHLYYYLHHYNYHSVMALTCAS